MIPWQPLHVDLHIQYINICYMIIRKGMSEAGEDSLQMSLALLTRTYELHSWAVSDFSAVQTEFLSKPEMSISSIYLHQLSKVNIWSLYSPSI